MRCSLRIMHFGFLISVIVAVLIIGKSLDASAEGTEVECPCNFESVPKTPGCWVDPFVGEQPHDAPVYSTRNDIRGCEVVSFECKACPTAILAIAVNGVAKLCKIERDGIVPQECTPQGTVEISLTNKQVKACQCELLAYANALNEVAGISVSPGPPYECFDVDCRQKVLTPIPTLNEYGMIITAGVLGLLAVIGLFVIRRRKVSA